MNWARASLPIIEQSDRSWAPAFGTASHSNGTPWEQDPADPNRLQPAEKPFVHQPRDAAGHPQTPDAVAHGLVDIQMAVMGIVEFKPDTAPKPESALEETRNGWRMC